jgi:enoyl-CoA hydratase
MEGEKVPLKVQRDGHIAIITFDDPPLNLFKESYCEELRIVIDSFADDSSVRVAVITGAGERSFTAGQDITGVKGSTPPPRENPRAVRNYVQALIDSAVPIIAAVNGYCLGHGIGIVANSDIVVASTNASFGLPEVNIGAGNGERFFRELFPKGHARHAFYTGERVSGEEAHRVGAVFRLVPPAELMTEAMKIATTISSKAPLLVRMFKETVKWTDDMDIQTAYRFEGQSTAALRRTPVGAQQMGEAREAFFEKREPVFE